MITKKRTYSLLVMSYFLTCGVVYYKQRSLMYSPNKDKSYDPNLWKEIVVNDKFLGFENLLSNPIYQYPKHILNEENISNSEEYFPHVLGVHKSTNTFHQNDAFYKKALENLKDSEAFDNEPLDILENKQSAYMYSMNSLNNTYSEKDSYDKEQLKTIVVFHGNSGNASSREYYHTFFNKMISKKNLYRIVVAEYPGFGLNCTETISKKNIIDNARSLMQYVLKNYPGEIIITGESLGTGIASQMASEFNVDKLFLITPYSSIKDVAQSRYWFLPVRLLLKDNFNSTQNLKNYQGKTLMLVAENDTVVPPKFADKLYKSIKSDKEKIFIHKAGHTDWIRYLTRTQRQNISQFLL